MENRYSWNWNVLLQERPKFLLIKLEQAMQDLACNRHVEQELRNLQQLCEEHLRGHSQSRSFKERTRNGGVWFRQRGQWEDIGNYAYTCLFLQFRSWCQRHDHFKEVFDTLSATWPRSLPSYPLSNSNYEMMGDVIEYILHPTYETGPNVAALDRQSRLHVQNVVKGIHGMYEDLDKILFSSALGGPPTVAMRPDAYLHTHILLTARTLHAGELSPHEQDTSIAFIRDWTAKHQELVAS